MARGLATWRVDQAHRRVRYQEAGVDTRVAQKALEPLVRRGLPAIKGAPRIRIDVRSLDANEELPSLLAVAELGYGPCRLERGGVFGKRDEQLIRNGRTPRCSGDMPGLPTENPFRKCPRIWKGALGGIRCEKLGDRSGVDRGLPQRG